MSRRIEIVVLLVAALTMIGLSVAAIIDSALDEPTTVRDAEEITEPVEPDNGKGDTQQDRDRIRRQDQNQDRIRTQDQEGQNGQQDQDRTRIQDQEGQEQQQDRDQSRDQEGGDRDRVRGGQ